MLATRNLRRQCSKSVPCLIRNPSRAIDFRRSLPAQPRVGSACWNRDLAGHQFHYVFEGANVHKTLHFEEAVTKMFMLEHLTTIRRQYLDNDFEEAEDCVEFEAENNYDGECADSESYYQLEPELCQVCMKVVDHPSHNCPYLNVIQNPENTPVGDGYKIFCRCCRKSDHGHPDGTWTGYAFKESWRAAGVTVRIL